MTNNLENIEVYEFNDDAVETFDDLNKKYRDTYDWIYETNKDFNKTNSEEVVIESETPTPYEVFKILSIPEGKNESKVELNSAYLSQETDPFARLLSLKHELADCKKEIDDYAELFKQNSFVQTKNNFSSLHEQINLYKAKIDAFIDYGIFNSLKEDSSVISERNEIEEDNDNSKNDNSMNNSKIDGSIVKKYSSNYDKNNVIISSLISKIKEIQNNLSNENNGNANEDNKESEKRTVTYEVIGNSVNQVGVISAKIGQLETAINELQKVIGDWNIYDSNESICSSLYKLVNFSLAKAGEKYEKKFQTAKDCAGLINNFCDKKNDDILMGSNYVKIKELYSILELYETFDQVFEYITRRFKAIKQIHENSDQFNTLTQNLNDNLIKVDDKYSDLKKEYEGVLNEFEKYQEELKRMEVLEDKIKKEFLI